MLGGGGGGSAHAQPQQQEEQQQLHLQKERREAGARMCMACACAKAKDMYNNIYILATTLPRALSPRSHKEAPPSRLPSPRSKPRAGDRERLLFTRTHRQACW